MKPTPIIGVDTHTRVVHLGPYSTPSGSELSKAPSRRVMWHRTGQWWEWVP